MTYRSALGSLLLMSVLTGCATGGSSGGLVYAGTGIAAITGRVNAIGEEGPGDQVAFQVDDSAHVAVFAFDMAGVPMLTLHRGGAGVVRAPRLARSVWVTSQSAASNWSETRCTNGDRFNQQAFTAAEMSSPAAMRPTSMVTCYSAPSSSGPASARTTMVKDSRTAPVLVIAARTPMTTESAAAALDLWARSGRDRGAMARLAQLVAGPVDWSAMLYDPQR